MPLETATLSLIGGQPPDRRPCFRLLGECACDLRGTFGDGDENEGGDYFGGRIGAFGARAGDTGLGAGTQRNGCEIVHGLRLVADAAQFSKPDGTTIQIDKKKREEVMVPVETARDVIKVGRLSAHAQVCDLPDDQIANHRTLMREEEAKGKWTPQQMVYISQLHLTTVMLLTGKIKLVEKDGEGKDVVVDGRMRKSLPRPAPKSSARRSRN